MSARSLMHENVRNLRPSHREQLVAKREQLVRQQQIRVAEIDRLKRAWDELVAKRQLEIDNLAAQIEACDE